MNIHYDTEKLNKILESLSSLTGINISFLDPSHNEICHYSSTEDFCSEYQAENGCESCESCDRELLKKCKMSGHIEEHFCHAGLYDAAMPLKKQETTVGYLLMGRLRTAASVPKDSFGEKLTFLYGKIPFLDGRRLQSLKELLANILFSDAVMIETDTAFEEACEYIENNLEKELNVPMLCKHLGIGKNRLYKIFGEAHGSAVNEYITEKRLERAKRLLCETELTVGDICRSCGINNEAYFCRMFKKHFGKTPTEYRKTAL